MCQLEFGVGVGGIRILVKMCTNPSKSLEEMCTKPLKSLEEMCKI